jgi:RNA polymerase sigma-70 factor (ECF subfamily)
MDVRPTEILWEAYCCRLLAFIRSRISDSTEAEDILQETFLRIHRGLCCREDSGPLEAWIFTIARHLIIDRYRRRRELVELPENLAAEPSLIDAEDDSSLAPSLREMIAGLPPAYREALLATEYDGLTQQEYARRAGISLSGAKSRVQRARGMLRDRLLACCHFEIDRRGGILDYYPRCCCCNPAAAASS